MPVTINADTVTGAAVVTADASGVLALQAAGNTGLTLNSSRAIGVGASPSFGSSGQVLQSNGSGAAPSWVTPSSGALVFLSVVTASNSATVDIETTFNSTYDNYVLVATNVTSATDGRDLNCRFRLSGSYDSGSNYRWQNQQNSLTTTTMSAGSSGGPATSISLASNSTMGNGAANTLAFHLYIYSPSSTTKTKIVNWSGVSTGSSAAANAGAIMQGAGLNTGTVALTGIQFFADSGNISTGTFRLYGIANS